MTVDWVSLLTAWTFRPLLLLIIILLVLYRRGWKQQQTGRPALFLAGLIVLIFARISPLNALASTFLFAKVTQHLLLISVFPALFMSSDPLPTLFRGLPGSWQRPLLSRWQQHRPLIRRLTPKSVCWFTFVAIVWIWHDPRMLSLIMEHDWIDMLASTLMVGGALLHWWHVASARPRLHEPLPGLIHIGYTLAGAAPLKLPGLFLLFAYQPIYPVDQTAAYGLTIDPLFSQQLGGMIIWALGGLVYTSFALVLLAQWFDQEADKPDRPRTAWDNEGRLVAPHRE